MLFKRKTEPVKQPKEHIRHDAADAATIVNMAGPMAGAAILRRGRSVTDAQQYAIKERGRHTEIAEKLGVSKRLVSHWIHGRKTPTLRHGLALQAFLKEQGKRRRKGHK
jgi:DNA-binding transcriptional regulator YiaG